MHYRSLITQIIFAKANVFLFVATVRIFLSIVSGFSLSINFAIFYIFRAVLFLVFPIWNIPCALSDNSISYNFNQFTQLYTFGNQISSVQALVNVIDKTFFTLTLISFYAANLRSISIIHFDWTTFYFYAFVFVRTR